MRILYCITRSDTIGGAHIHVADMTDWMLRNGHWAHIVVGGGGVYCEELRRRKLPFTSLEEMRRDIGLVQDLASVRALRRVIASLKPDIVSLHSSKAGVVGRLAAFRLQTRVLFTAHGWSFTEGVPRRSATVYRYIEKLMSNLCDRIITVSEFDRQLAVRKRVCKESQITTIRNGMPDISRKTHEMRDDGLVELLMVARLDQQKDHETLLRALYDLRCEFEWHLTLVGDGPLRKTLEAMVERLGIADSVSFVGMRNDVSDWMSRADVFILTSNYEGFPRSILEAMRSTLPVVASDVGGVSESVVDGQTGFLIQRKDSSSLRSRLRQLIEDADLRSNLGQQGRRSFETSFTFEKMARETIRVYTELIGTKHTDEEQRLIDSTEKGQ